MHRQSPLRCRSTFSQDLGGIAAVDWTSLCKLAAEMYRLVSIDVFTEINTLSVLDCSHCSSAVVNCENSIVD